MAISKIHWNKDLFQIQICSMITGMNKQLVFFICVLPIYNSQSKQEFRRKLMKFNSIFCDSIARK